MYIPKNSPFNIHFFAVVYEYLMSSYDIIIIYSVINQ